MVPNNRLIRLRECLSILPISESTFRRLVKSGEIPPPVQISGRTVGYLHSEIQEFVTKLLTNRDTTQHSNEIF